MRFQLYKNHDKTSEEHPDFIVKQKQRLNDGTTAYETVEIGYAYTLEGPEEKYIDVTLPKFGNNNKP